jgi:pSer/pThr/pTyr-binding forkhead associated (FHA) protein
MSTLTLQLPGLPPVSHVLQEDTLTVGRMAGNTIVVDDASVSMFHARITRKDGLFFLRDLNSTNGTMINGQSVREARLRDLDRVQFGDVCGQFMADAAATVITLADKGALSAPAPVPVAAAVPLKSPPQPAAPFDLGRFMSSLVPYMGAVAALGVVCGLVWKLKQSGKEGPEAALGTGASVTLAVAKPDATAAEAPHDTASGKGNSESSSPPDLRLVADGATGAVVDLVRALKSPDAAERRRAATALHSMGADAKAATPALREALKDSDADVRMWSALTLINNECYDKTTIPILVNALKHDNPEIRQVACLSLGVIPYDASEKEAVVPALAGVAGKDSIEEVRNAALKALNVVDPGSVARLGGK